jgi:hypothetical protein
VSNFILVEQYEPKRDAETWKHVLDQQLAGMPVRVCQATSTITFFWKLLANRLHSLNSGNLPEAVRSWLSEQLLPAYYLQRAAEKADTVAERQA